MKNIDSQIMQRTIMLASENIKGGGLPFSAVIVKGGQILSEGVNSVHLSHDPSDHAEIQAIRKACEQLGRPNLGGCDVYVVGMPCPMCMACLIFAKPDKVIFAVDTKDKDTALKKLPLTQELYDMISLPLKNISIELVHLEEFSVDGREVFTAWNKSR